jgi:hypothetical protein
LFFKLLFLAGRYRSRFRYCDCNLFINPEGVASPVPKSQSGSNSSELRSNICERLSAMVSKQTWAEIVNTFRVSLRDYLKLNGLIFYGTAPNHNVEPARLDHGLHVEIYK